MSKITVLIIILLAFVVSSACSFSVSTANFSDLKTGLEIKDSEVVKNVDKFKTDTPQIFASAKLNNAPDGTEVTITWKYLEGKGIVIDSVNLTTKSGENVVNSTLTKPPTNWPPGKYEVVFKINTDNAKPARKSFTVE